MIILLQHKTEYVFGSEVYDIMEGITKYFPTSKLFKCFQKQGQI